MQIRSIEYMSLRHKQFYVMCFSLSLSQAHVYAPFIPITLTPLLHIVWFSSQKRIMINLLSAGMASTRAVFSMEKRWFLNFIRPSMSTRSAIEKQCHPLLCWSCEEDSLSIATGGTSHFICSWQRWIWSHVLNNEWEKAGNYEALSWKMLGKLVY